MGLKHNRKRLEVLIKSEYRLPWVNAQKLDSVVFSFTSLLFVFELEWSQNATCLTNLTLLTGASGSYKSVSDTNCSES